MRNLRKLTAAVLAIALVLTSMTATFAAETATTTATTATVVNADKAATLKSLDLYAGKDATDPKIGLEDALTTEQSLTFLAKLFGYTAETEKLTDAEVTEALAKFEDGKDVATYAKKIVAYSAINSILSGSTSKDGKKFFVGAKDTVTAARFATFMLKQMGYVVPSFLDSATQISEVKGSKVAVVTGDLTRDTAVGIMYGALTAEKVGGATVIAGIVGTDTAKLAIATKAGLITTPATAELVVDSITAINTKQVVVTFNQAMNKDSAQTESFYAIKNKGSDEIVLGEDSAVLGDDGKTVTITLNKVLTDKLTNSTTAKVIVNKDIKALNGNKLAVKVEKDVKVEDGFIPTVTKVEATGEYTVKVTFSEPVYGGDISQPATSNFSAKSGTYTYFCQKALVDGNVINLTLSTKLVEGPISVIVNSDGTDKTSAIQDYAGYKVFKGETTFNYVRDTSVAVVTVSAAKALEVTLKFSKSVKGKFILYHSASGAVNYKSEKIITDYTNEITFKFPKENPVPSGTGRQFFLVGGTLSGEEMIDGYGIKVPDQTLTYDVVVDVTAPTVTATELDGNKNFKLTFDEALESTVANYAANYVVKSVSDSKTVPLTALYDNEKKLVTLNFPGLLADNTDYQLDIKKVQDIYGNKNSADIVITFKTGDNTSPYLKDGKGTPVRDLDCYALKSEGKVYIAFTEAMNEAQMLDKGNYQVDYSLGYKALGDNDTITKISDRKILIYVKELKSYPSARVDVKVASITDLAGKRLAGMVDSQTVFDIGSEAVSVKSADLVAKNKLKITFDKQMKTVDRTDILIKTTPSAIVSVTPPAVQYIESHVTNSDGNSEIVVVLDKELNTDVTDANGVGVIIALSSGANSISMTDAKLTSIKDNKINDKVAPELKKWNDDGTTLTDEVPDVRTSLYTLGSTVKSGVIGTITLTFTEAINQDTLSTLTFKVDGYSVTKILAVNNKIELTVKADADGTAVRTAVTQSYNIADKNGNVFASGNTWAVTHQ